MPTTLAGAEAQPRRREDAERYERTLIPLGDRSRGGRLRERDTVPPP